MKVINLRNIPDELHRALKVKAAQEGTTLEKLIVGVLEAMLEKAEKKEEGR